MKKVKREVPKTCEACRELDDLNRGTKAMGCKWLHRDKQCIDMEQCIALIKSSRAAMEEKFAKMLEEKPELLEALQSITAMQNIVGNKYF